MTNEQSLIALIITLVFNIIFSIYLSKVKGKNQLKKIFIIIVILLTIWLLGLIMQLTLSGPLNIKPIYFDYIVYIAACFLPVAIFFTGLIFSNTKIVFKEKYLFLFIVPITSLLVLWTNDFHHLFYKNYSVDFTVNQYGPYFTIHNIYSYLMLFIGVIYLLRFSIKNSGLFSKQSTLITLGVSVPIIVNILGTFQIIHMNIYITPITFVVAIFCFAMAIFKFDFLGVSPIAMQKIVDRISDSFIVIGDDNKIVDYNKTFIDTFKIKENKLRGNDITDILKINNIKNIIEKTQKTGKTTSFEYTFEKINRYFTIEITSINSNNIFLGTLILLKDITQHKQDMKIIQNNQDLLIERERLASLGQLVGGIAHNLKTPIMSIAGASQGLKDLVDEYDASIGNPIVNNDDYHEIAKDMREWLDKINSYTEYMSDVITAVKGQTTTLANEAEVNFTIGELFKRVNILMKHELKNEVIYLNISMKIDENTNINGNINSLVQVINNMIDNSINAYNGKRGETIELIASKEGNNLIISVKDYGEGMTESVKKKLFKEMITTKGKNGTGLGLYMSYSTIKANFNGDITVESEKGKGTTFNIIIPIN